MVERRIHAMHKRYGIDWENTCKNCQHCIKYTPTDRHYYKCELYGVSGSEATDWRLSWMACGAFNLDINLDLWVPVLDDLKHATHPPAPPIDGQMDISSFMSEA